MELSNRLNFSQNCDHTSAIKLFSKNRDLGYYYDNLCLYCANNDIDIKQVSDQDFTNCADVMRDHCSDNYVDNYYFWID